MERNLKIEEEIKNDIDQLIKKIANYVNLPENSDIKNTPNRIYKMMFNELISGYFDNPKKYLRTFKSNNLSTPMIIENIPIKSLCEHHFLPMFGYANIVIKYKAKANVLGLSKFYRIVNSFARKFQLQENLTNEIANFLYENLDLEGVAVILDCEHFCVKMRGVNVDNTRTKTIAGRGIYQDYSKVINF